MSSRRASDAVVWARYLGVIRPTLTPVEASIAQFLLVHTSSYLQSLEHADGIAEATGLSASVLNVDSLWNTTRLAVGGTIAAAQRVVAHGGRAANMLGGFHHARPEQGGGFCLINDVAVAIAVLREQGYKGRIGVVDLDAHPPDGIAACLGDKVQILSVSSECPWDTLAPPAIDLRLPAHTGDTVYLKAVKQVLQSRKSADLWFYLAGADPLRGDKLGGLQVSLPGLMKRDQLVFRALKRKPTVILPAGGYHPHSWRVFAQTLSAAAGLNAVPTSAFNPTRLWARWLDTHTPPEADFDPTDADLYQSLGFAPKTARLFLGRWSRHGIERVLNQFQLLPALTAMGFKDLAFKLDLGEIDRLRITALINNQQETIVDLAVALQSGPSGKELFIHWLELRDPRGQAGSNRGIPGQRAPGLGLSKEALAVLIRAAKHLSCSAVAFNPAHFHIAWVSRHSFSFVDINAKSAFDAISSLLNHQPPEALAAISQLASGPGLPAHRGPPIRYLSGRYLHPLNDNARTLIQERATQAAPFTKQLIKRLKPYPPEQNHSFR